jgi:hypothetical protein
VGGRPPSTCRVADYHSVKELGFQLLDRRDRTLLQGGGGSIAIRHSGEHWAFVHLQRLAFWCHSLNRGLQLSSQWGI